MNNKLIVKDLFILTNKLKRLLEKRYQEHGLYVGQARILIHLYKKKDEKTYQKDIENTFQIRGGTVTGMIDILEKNGYINRIESTEDRRKRKLILTKKGEEVALMGIKTHSDIENSINNIMKENERLVFYTILEKLNQWIDEEETN